MFTWCYGFLYSKATHSEFLGYAIYTDQTAQQIMSTRWLRCLGFPLFSIYLTMFAVVSSLILQYPRLAAVTGLPFLSTVGPGIALEILYVVLFFLFGIYTCSSVATKLVTDQILILCTTTERKALLSRLPSVRAITLPSVAVVLSLAVFAVRSFLSSPVGPLWQQA